MRPRIAGGDTACVDGGRGSRLHAVIKKLFEALVVFTLIVGVWFVVAVVVRVVSAFASHKALGGNIVIALLDLMAGVVILAGPDLGLGTGAVIIGIVLIVRGGLLVAAGRQLRTLDRAPESDRVAGAVA
jgi:uncharacterized membrane protein HdeD (DUF308 family)